MIKIINTSIIILSIFLFVSSGCSYRKVRKAFSGKMSYIEGNKVISEYCQSCHVHRNLEPNEHVVKKSQYYRRERYKRAKECRTCHGIKVNFWEEVAHETGYPSEEVVPQ